MFDAQILKVLRATQAGKSLSAEQLTAFVNDIFARWDAYKQDDMDDDAMDDFIDEVLWDKYGDDLDASADAALILAVKGHEPRLEKKIRRLQEAAWGMKAVPRIVVVDCGMEEATLRAAKDLAAWDTTFTLCSKEELEKILFELTKQETQRV